MIIPQEIAIKFNMKFYFENEIMEAICL